MATRRKEQQLQQEIETQEEWEDMLSKEGLCGTYRISRYPDFLRASGTHTCKVCH